MTIGRRSFAKLGALAVAGVFAAKRGYAQSSGATSAAGLPARGELLLRSGTVITMEPGIPDLRRGDVHVRDGVIIAVGDDISAPAAEIIDARDMIVMPGFIDAHWHLWNTFLRGSIRGDDPKYGYFPVTSRAAAHCTPLDAYNSVRFSLAEALTSGITTVHDWCHNVTSPAHADAEFRAIESIGMRGRFSYGPSRALRADEPMDLADLARVQLEWLPNRPMLSLSANLRTPPMGVPATDPAVIVFLNEYRAVRKLGLQVTLHYGNNTHGLVALMHDNGLLDEHLLLIHPQGFTEEERKILVAAKVRFSTSPAIEIPYSTVRNGYTQFAELEQMGAQMSLSIDSSGASATADFFNVMRALQWSHKQRADTKLILTPKRIVEIATIEGARALGIDDQTGSLKPGKRADIALVRATDLNIAPMLDPYYALVYSGQPANVDTVIVDGRVLRRGGKFTSLDERAIVREATASGLRVETAMAEILRNGGR